MYLIVLMKRYDVHEHTCTDVRGYMTARGRPDGPRSARYILKDYVNGRLLYCHPPPGVDPATFNQFSPLLPGRQTKVDNIETKVSGEGQSDTTDSSVEVNMGILFDRQYVGSLLTGH